MRRVIVLALAVLLTGCVPIGVRVQNMRILSLLGFKPVTVNVTDPARSSAPFTVPKYVSRRTLSAHGDDGELFAVPAPPKALKALRGLRVSGATYVYVSKAQWHQAVNVSHASPLQ